VDSRTRLDVALQLDALCAEHGLTEAAAAAVRGLLEAHAPPAGPAGGAADAGLPVSGRATRPIEQRTIGGRYVVGPLLGKGGMGQVFRCWDRALERAVAVKLLAKHLLDDERSRSRFLAEASLTAGLEHPGIVPVHDRGETEEGVLWYAMKLVEGDTLQGVAVDLHHHADPAGFRRTGVGWSFRRLVDAFRRVCEAMAFAHRMGVIHRDLKPSNIMLGPHGEALVMDWGLARRVGGESTPGGRPPTPAPLPAVSIDGGNVVGTPGYLAPEAVRGTEGRLDPAIDVYSLGGVLYFLLSGRHPYSDRPGNPVVRALLESPTPLPNWSRPARRRSPRPWRRCATSACRRSPVTGPATRWRSRGRWKPGSTVRRCGCRRRRPLVAPTPSGPRSRGCGARSSAWS
jgi:serine/threonine-protein kinase